MFLDDEIVRIVIDDKELSRDTLKKLTTICFAKIISNLKLAKNKSEARTAILQVCNSWNFAVNTLNNKGIYILKYDGLKQLIQQDKILQEALNKEGIILQTAYCLTTLILKNMDYHTTKDGRKIKLSDLSTEHLLNIIKYIERKAKNGIVVESGNPDDCTNNPEYDRDVLYGDDVKEMLHYEDYKAELEHRLKNENTDNNITF